MTVTLKRVYVDISTEVHDVLTQAAKDRQTSKKALLEQTINEIFGGNTDGTTEKEGKQKTASKAESRRVKAQRSKRK